MPTWAAAQPVARLATVGDPYPHLVPVVFCEVDRMVYVPVDGKPKSQRRLQRLVNIERNPHVCLLVDVYAEDWSQLRWLRIDGEARVVPTAESVAAALRTKYPQYADTAVGTEAVRIAATRVRSWSADGLPADLGIEAAAGQSTALSNGDLSLRAD